VHDDLVGRNFTAPTVDVKWLTDITEHPTSEGKLYFCAIKDCASNRIVGYSMASRMTSDLAVAALHNAIARRSPTAPVLRPPIESTQFRSRKYLTALRSAGLLESMGRFGARRFSTANSGTPATSYGWRS
jgi:putative transposase